MAKTTRNVINGSAPYLTFDGGRTRATNSDELLSITLPGGTRIMPSTNPSSASKPIVLQHDNVRFSDIGMFIPANTSSVELDALIDSPYNYWGDDDGDGQGSRDGISATGKLTLSIVDKEGKAVDRRDTLDICRAPYKVTLRSNRGTLSTRYGFPKSRNFSANSAIYYINPKESPLVCFVRPYLGGSGRYAGPSNIWNPDRGFLVQSTESSGYHRNFPTTGAHNLYFDLDIGGVNANQLSWSPVTHSGITASMTPDSLRARVRVTLTGPVATLTQMSSDSPSTMLRPALPATFELVGRDSSGRAVIKYGFELKQWFVHQKTERHTYSDSLSWCNRIGYSMPKVRDLTNAVRTDVSPLPVGASPSSSGNYYMRNIDAGFFTEWGNMYQYHNSSFFVGGYWTSGAMGSYQFTVFSGDGSINWRNPSAMGSVVCASVLRS
jgi:hypothetical protein